MVPATCQNCEPSSAPKDRHGDPSLEVVLGVLGGLALTAVLVFVVVPVVRRRRGAHSRRGDAESNLVRRNSRRSSGRVQEPKAGGPEALLPLLPELSSFTWSDLRSKDASAESSDDELDAADTYSFPTNRADLSHPSSLRLAKEKEPVYASVLGGPLRTASAGASPPFPKRSLTPPGLPSKASPYTLLDASPTSPSGDAPRVLLPASRATYPTPNINMEPVPEGYVREARARPGSLQLPSPPASPPVSSSSHYSHSRSHAPSHSRTPSLSADFRIRNARPPLSSTHSAPATALPFRPPSSSTSTPAWWSTTTSSHPSATTPLAPAFRLHRSGSQSTSTRSDSARHPPVSAPPMPTPDTAPPPPSTRVRSGSVMSERPARTPQGARPKPAELLRTGSSTVEELRAARRASIATTPSASLTASNEDEARRRKAYVRSSMSVQTPHIEESYTSDGQSVAPTFFDTRRHQMISPLTMDGSSSSYLSPDGDTVPPDLNSIPPSRRSSISQVHQPNLVRRKDSSALKPLPVSAILHSPPNSPPRNSREASLSSFTSRSRAGSIASVAGTSDASHRSRLGRRPSVRTVLPPVDRLPPLEFGEFEDET